MPPLAAEALAAVMAEAAMPEHGSTAEMELSDAPDPIPVLSTDALPGGTSVGVVPMELDTADSKRSFAPAVRGPPNAV